MKRILVQVLTALMILSMSLISTNTYVFANMSQNELFVHFIDVGQGDSILIVTPDQETILIDGGETAGGRIVADYLRSLNIDAIDFMIATHPHADHINGLTVVLNQFEVRNIYAPRVSHTTVAYRNFLTAIQNQGLTIKNVTYGVTLPIESIFATFVGPVREYGTNLNNWSAVLHITHGENTFIFTGDVERTSELDMINVHGNTMQADVLKVSHHGSNTSTTQEFLDVVRPSIAVIQVGRNSFGHPTPQVLDRLEQIGAAVYRTDFHGTIVIISDGYQLEIRTGISNFDGEVSLEGETYLEEIYY